MIYSINEGQQAIIDQTRAEMISNEQLKEEYNDNDPLYNILNLSVRSYNCLRRSGINTIDQLVSMTREDLLKIRNISTKCVDEIDDKLSKNGLKLS